MNKFYVIVKGYDISYDNYITDGYWIEGNDIEGIKEKAKWKFCCTYHVPWRYITIRKVFDENFLCVTRNI